MRRAARSDTNRGEIVSALRAIGCKVYDSKQPLDLLVAFRGKSGSYRTFLVEVKTADGAFTRAQKDFMETWPGEFHVVRTPEEAVKAAVGAEALA